MERKMATTVMETGSGLVEQQVAPECEGKANGVR